MTIFRISANKKIQEEKINSLESRLSYLEGEVKVLQTKDNFTYDLLKDIKKEMRSEFKDIKKDLKELRKK